MTFLVHDIIAISQPIRITEIKEILSCLGIESSENYIKRFIYLLNRLGLIDSYEYSRTDYYYSLSDVKKIKFGKDKNNKNIDRTKIVISLRQYIVASGESSEKKRVNVLKHLREKGVIC